MTEEEYYKIKELIKSQIKTEWISVNYIKKNIPMYGVNYILDELRKMVKNK